MNWAAWTLIAYFIVSFIVAVARVGTGRKAVAPLSAGAAVLAAFITAILIGALIALVVLAAVL